MMIFYRAIQSESENLLLTYNFPNFEINDVFSFFQKLIKLIYLL